MSDRIDGMVSTILAAAIGMVMLASFALPLIAKEIAKIEDIEALSGYSDILWMVPLFMVIGLILFLIRRFNSEGRD